MIRDIDTALERLATGNYGECEMCGMDIGLGRLRALPTATVCVDCATAREKRQRLLGSERESDRILLNDKGFETGVALEDAE